MEPGTIATDGTITLANTPEEANIKQIDGPTEENKAITCPAASMLNVMYDPESDNNISNFTIMYDVRINALGAYNSLFQSDLDNKTDADFCISPSGTIGLNTGWTYGGQIYKGFWHRIVLSVKDNVPSAYLDGNLVAPGTSADSRWSLANKGFYLFCDDNGECMDIDVAEIRYWKQTLTNDQIQKLGGVDYKYIFTTQPTVGLSDNNNTFSINFKSSVVPKVETSDWIKPVSVNPTTGEQTFTFKADDLTEAGSREGTITLSAADGSDVTPCVIKVTQKYDGGSIPTCSGKWTFEDQNSLFTSTEGTATLTPYVLADNGTLTPLDNPANADVMFISGPSQDNNAITLNRGTTLKLGLNEESPLTNYSIQYDIRTSEINSYYGLLQTNLNNNSDAVLFISNDGRLGLGIMGYGGHVDTDTWYRILYVVKDGCPQIYENGELIRSATTSDDRWTMDKTGAFLFCDNDGETGTFDIAELDFWNFALSASQVARIGIIK
jgi:hypothetical protein